MSFQNLPRVEPTLASSSALQQGSSTEGGVQAPGLQVTVGRVTGQPVRVREDRLDRGSESHLVLLPQPVSMGAALSLGLPGPLSSMPGPAGHPWLLSDPARRPGVWGGVPEGLSPTSHPYLLLGPPLPADPPARLRVSPPATPAPRPPSLDRCLPGPWPPPSGSLACTPQTGLGVPLGERKQRPGPF